MFKISDLDLICGTCMAMVRFPTPENGPHITICVHNKDRVVIAVDGQFWDADLKEFVEAFQKYV